MLISALIVVAVVGIFYFGFNPLSLFGGTSLGGDSTYSINGETNEYYDYHLIYSKGGTSEGCSTPSLEKSFSFTTFHWKLPDGDNPYLPYEGSPVANQPYRTSSNFVPVPKDDVFHATNIFIENVKAVSNCGTSLEKDEYPVFENLNVDCQMIPYPGSYKGAVTPSSGMIACTWTGKIKAQVPVSFKGVDVGSADIKMYKTGFSAPIREIGVYRLQNNQCSFMTIPENQKTIDDYDTLNECQTHVISIPDTPTPKPSQSWLGSLIQKIVDFLKKFFTLSITGTGVNNGSIIVEPNTNANYQINLAALKVADTQESKSWQWGHYAVTDKDGNVYNGLISEPELINGVYTKDISIMTPSNIGNYALTSWITEVDATWNAQTGKWDYTNETIVAQEITSLQTRYSVTEANPPTPKASSSWLSSLIQSVINFFKKLFGI